MLTKGNLLTYLIALLIILTLNFFLPRMMPGDPLMAIYGDEALVQMSPQLKADLTERFALDQSLAEQFASYWLALFRGDLGYSYSYNAPVTEVIFGRLPWTLLLAGLALLLSTAIGIMLGIESGWRRGGRFDSGVLSGMVTLSGFPDFFLGILLLLLFAVNLKVLPLFGAEDVYSGLSGFARLIDIGEHLILPLTTLVLARITGGYLLTRNTMIGVLKEPYILLARAKGLKPRTVKYRHAGRNSMLPVMTQTGIWMGLMVTGVLFIEVVFSYPGIGLLAYDALTFRDYPVLQGLLLVSAFCVLGANFIVDLLYARVDPRVSYAH
ncbi:MAG TPA: ABC transporter permease [Dehalococcoidia bacterium]|nr:ABC transporter permease [Dehalococcoidia bacterium]